MDEAVARARAFAITAHGEQRYGDQPYRVHLDAVTELLAPFGEQAQVVGYLHDVVEDTTVTLETVSETFGDRVAACLALVTDEPGVNRRERKARTNAKLAELGDAAAEVLEKLPEGASVEVRLRAAALLERIDGVETNPQRVRELRAVRALEWSGTAQARKVLRRLASGAPDAWLTWEAREALHRIGD